MKELFYNLKFAWIYAKDQKKRLIAYLFTNFVHIVISIVVPLLSARIIVNLTENAYLQVIVITFVLFGVETMRNVVSYLTRYFSSKIYRETFIKIQSDLGREILRLENNCIDQHSSGVFIQRLTNDTSRIADVFNVLNIYLTNIITNIGIFGAIFIINKIVFITLIFMVFIIYLVESRRVRVMTEKDKSFRKKNEKISGFIGELVRGIRDIKMLSAEESFMNELEGKVKDLNQERYQMVKTDNQYSFFRGTLLDVTDVIIILLLVYFIYFNELTIASALVVHNYMGRVTSIIDYFSILLEKLKDFNLSSSRIFSIIESSEFPKEQFGTKHLEKVEGNFEFKMYPFSMKRKRKCSIILVFMCMQMKR